MILRNLYHKIRSTERDDQSYLTNSTSSHTIVLQIHTSVLVISHSISCLCNSLIEIQILCAEQAQNQSAFHWTFITVNENNKLWQATARLFCQDEAGVCHMVCRGIKIKWDFYWVYSFFYQLEVKPMQRQTLCMRLIHWNIMSIII